MRLPPPHQKKMERYKNKWFRLTLDKDLKTDYSTKTVGCDNHKTIVLNQVKNQSFGNLTFLRIESFDLNNILIVLYNLNIQSIIIEGGKYTIEQFIKNNIWDEARLLTGINHIDNGILSPQIEGITLDTYNLGKDSIQIITNSK